MLIPFLFQSAVVDIQGLHAYFEERQSAPLAERFVSAVFAAIGYVAEFPEMGAIHQTRNKQLVDVRYWTIREFPNYVIYYRTDGKRLMVMRVVHGARKVNKLLRDLN